MRKLENLAMLGVERCYVAVERFATRPLSTVVAAVGRTELVDEEDLKSIREGREPVRILERETVLIGGDTKLWESKHLMDSIVVDVDDGCTGGADVISLQVEQARVG
jgi:hypothetical protein